MANAYINNFFDSEASNQSTATGATAKTTAQMKTQATFTDAGWNLTTVWQMIGVNYPDLQMSIKAPNRIQPIFTGFPI